MEKFKRQEGTQSNIEIFKSFGILFIIYFAGNIYLMYYTTLMLFFAFSIFLMGGKIDKTGCFFWEHSKPYKFSLLIFIILAGLTLALKFLPVQYDFFEMISKPQGYFKAEGISELFSWISMLIIFTMLVRHNQKIFSKAKFKTIKRSLFKIIMGIYLLMLYLIVFIYANTLLNNFDFPHVVKTYNCQFFCLDIKFKNSNLLSKPGEATYPRTIHIFKDEPNRFFN